MAIKIVDFPIKNGGSFHSYGTVYQRVLLKFPFCGVLRFRPIRWRWTSIIFLGIYLARVERRENSKRLLLCYKNWVCHLDVPEIPWNMCQVRDTIPSASCWIATRLRGHPLQFLDLPKSASASWGRWGYTTFPGQRATGRAKSKYTIHQNDYLYLLKLDLPNVLICLDCMKPPSLTLCWVQYWQVMHDFQPPGSSVWRQQRHLGKWIPATISG